MEEKATLDEKDLAEILDSFLLNNATLKDVRGLTEKDMEAIYSIGYTFYNNGKYEDAHAVFQFLSFYDHLEKRWWMGLGATRQMLENFEEAVMAYSYAATLDVEDPSPHLHAADCFLAMKRYEDAKNAFHAAAHFAGDKEEHSDKKQRAEAMIKILEGREEGGDPS